MANDKPKNQTGRQKLSAVTQAFITNQDAIKRFVSRFLYRQQDIDDVAQEAFLKAYNVELKRDIEHPKAYLFQIARNVALEAQIRMFGADSEPGQHSSTKVFATACTPLRNCRLLNNMSESAALSFNCRTATAQQGWPIMSRP
ncbi:RNA polymerase sigma factor [Porticoccaceae bacterium]|nr:RNA polymerase sigma factor [Porticoccaceae bacterium]